MATDLKFLRGTAEGFKGLSSWADGTLYFATIDNKAYMYLGKDNTGYIRIVPELLEVANGGTGRSSLTSGHLLYGNGTGPIGLLAPGTAGQVLVSSGSAPTYTTPSMSWSTGVKAGPKFNFIFDGVTFAGTAIPSASTSQSGIVTAEDQSFKGVKTFTSGLNIGTTSAGVSMTYDASSDTLTIF